MNPRQLRRESQHFCSLLEDGRAKYAKGRNYDAVEKLRKALAGDGAPAAAVDARGGDYGKSSKFFEQLQRDVSAAVRGGRADYAAPEPPKRKRAKRADAAKLG